MKSQARPSTRLGRCNFYQPNMRDGADDWTLRSSSGIMTSRGYLDRGDLLVYGVNFVRRSRDYDRAVASG